MIKATLSGAATIAALAEPADAEEPADAAEPADAVVVIGGVEHHVGGWADYEATRRAAARYGAAPADLYPGRTYVTAADVVDSLASDQTAQLESALAAVREAHGAVIGAYHGGRGKPITVVQGAAGARADAVMDAAAALHASLPDDAGLDELQAAAEGAAAALDAHAGAMAGIVELDDAARLRAAEARLAPAANARDMRAARVLAYAAAVVAAAAQFEGWDREA